MNEITDMGHRLLKLARKFNYKKEEYDKRHYRTDAGVFIGPPYIAVIFTRNDGVRNWTVPLNTLWIDFTPNDDIMTRLYGPDHTRQLSDDEVEVLLAAQTKEEFETIIKAIVAINKVLEESE